MAIVQNRFVSMIDCLNILEFDLVTRPFSESFGLTSNNV